MLQGRNSIVSAMEHCSERDAVRHATNYEILSRENELCVRHKSLLVSNTDITVNCCVTTSTCDFQQCHGLEVSRREQRPLTKNMSRARRCRNLVGLALVLFLAWVGARPFVLLGCKACLRCGCDDPIVPLRLRVHFLSRFGHCGRLGRGTLLPRSHLAVRAAVEQPAEPGGWPLLILITLVLVGAALDSLGHVHLDDATWCFTLVHAGFPNIAVPLLATAVGAQPLEHLEQR